MDYFNILLLILGLFCPFTNSIEVLSREDETKLLQNPVEFALIFSALQSSGKVDPELLNLYAENHTARYNVFISFIPTPCLILPSIADEIDAIAPNYLKATKIYQKLLPIANEVQKTVENLLVTDLFALNDSFYKLWITNQIYVKSVSAYLIYILAGNKEVAAILPDILVQLIYPLLPQLGILCHPPKDVVPDPPWGVTTVNAPQVHDLGTKGQNVIVAIIDTGVDGTHLALSCSYIGNENNGWMDGTFTTVSTIPVDDMGHGTHVMGILVGGDCTNSTTNPLPRIGIAPLAVWRACKGLNALGIGLLINLIICFQWILCPKLNKFGECVNTPDVLSCSWGSNTMDVDPNTQCMLKVMKLAGIKVFFAAGNAGSSGCGTVGSPGVSLEVIAVAATSQDKSVAYFSSRGPGNDKVNIFKPDVSGPGHLIYSAWPNNANQNPCYAILSGTSMATPLVAGVAALIISKAKENNLILSFEAVLYILNSTASKDLTPSQPICGTGIPKPFGYVDYGYGYGIVNALTAHTKVAGCTTLDCIYT